jgi:transposase
MVHVRRRFYEIAQGGDAPIAEEALARIAALYRIEAVIRGEAPERRRARRQEQSRPVVDELRAWLEARLAKVPGGSRIAGAIRYALRHWSGLGVFLDDGRVEIDSNTVERAIRPIALNRKNALFAGSDQGGVHWGVIASLIETCKLNAVDPQAYLARTLIRLVNRHPASRIDDLMPWAYADQVP